MKKSLLITTILLASCAGADDTNWSFDEEAPHTDEGATDSRTFRTSDGCIDYELSLPPVESATRNSLRIVNNCDSDRYVSWVHGMRSFFGDFEGPSPPERRLENAPGFRSGDLDHLPLVRFTDVDGRQWAGNLLGSHIPDTSSYDVDYWLFRQFITNRVSSGTSFEVVGTSYSEVPNPLEFDVTRVSRIEVLAPVVTASSPFRSEAPWPTLHAGDLSDFRGESSYAHIYYGSTEDHWDGLEPMVIQSIDLDEPVDMSQP